MPNTIFNLLNSKLDSLATSAPGSLPLRQGLSLYQNGQCKKLNETEKHFEFIVDDKHGDFIVAIDFEEKVKSNCTCKSHQLCRHQIASYLQLREMQSNNMPSSPGVGIKYSREGMIKRVIEERLSKAKKANYSIEFADNTFGEHLLTNEEGKQYHISFRDLNRKHGYCSCPDYRTNKLGTCKHLIFAFEKISNEKDFLPENLPEYPFVEVFLNPFRENKISWFYPEKPTGEVAELIYRYFGNKNFIEDEAAENFIGFINNAIKYKQILIRPEVPEKIGRISETMSLSRLKTQSKVSFTDLHSDLLPFQKKGIQFSVFKRGAIIADEMGLGKSIQAIGAALVKKQLLGFLNTMVICPVSLMDQWIDEIKKFTNEQVLNLDDLYGKSKQLIPQDRPFFIIASYENLISNYEVIRKVPPDFLVLDEAQRIVNYESLTFSILKSIRRKHVLALTGSIAETKLIDLYSLMLLVEPDLVTPLWEFSYQHCYFDEDRSNKITGFYDLSKLNEKLDTVLIKRQKHEVIDELPSLSQFNIPVKMHPEQQKLHQVFAEETLGLVSKKITNLYDAQKLQGIFRNMRMVSNSTYLIDNTTNFSPKLDELDHMLHGKIDILNSKRKVVIFTEWKRMLNMIAKMLESKGVQFIEITFDTTEKNRQQLLKRFNEDDQCKIILTCDNASKNLDLNNVDTIINFDTPLSISQKKLRLGVIDPIQQRSANLTIINLMAENSIESWALHGMENQLNQINHLISGDDSGGDMELTSEIKKILVTGLNKLLINSDSEDLKKMPSGLIKKKTGQMEIDFSEEELESKLETIEEGKTTVSSDQQKDTRPSPKKTVDKKELRKALKSGVDFLSQLVKVSTGESIELKGKDIDLDMDSGEIVIKFKISDRTKSN